jgi:hypothetical protein
MKQLISKERLDPRPACPAGLVEQHPWHWDPMEPNHTDHTNYIGNIKFDWKGLGDWAVERSNEVRTPHRYWYLDEETGKIWHGDEDTTGNPIEGQAIQHFKLNNYNEHNTQYFKFANQDLEHWYEPLKALFPELKHMGISLFVQMPGQTIPCHADTFSSYMRRIGEWPDYSKVARYIVFVRDWDFGHFLHYGNCNINQWRSGDLWDAKLGVYHGSANAGIMPKLTIHWSGEFEGSFEDQWKHVEFNDRPEWFQEK